MSGFVAENRPPIIMVNDIERLTRVQAPSVQQRMDRVLAELVRDTDTLGNYVEIQGLNQLERYIAKSYSSSAVELQFLLQSLGDRRFVIPRTDRHAAAVLPAGFQRIDEISAPNSQSPIGFCAMWFGDEVRELWTDAIEPAVADAGYDPKRIDNVEHNNRIDEEIIVWIRRSRFVIADLTGQRAGVYFEAGFAQGFGVPVIWTVRDDELERVHFDNRQFNFIVWRRDALADARDRLRNRIQATIGDGPRRNRRNQ